MIQTWAACHRFYVKTILFILKPQKLPFWPFKQLWILNFWKLLTLLSVKCFQKSNFKASKIIKTAVFDLLKSTKIDFTWNHNGRKISKFPHCGSWQHWFLSFLQVSLCVSLLDEWMQILTYCLERRILGSITLPLVPCVLHVHPNS